MEKRSENAQRDVTQRSNGGSGSRPSHHNHTKKNKRRSGKKSNNPNGGVAPSEGQQGSKKGYSHPGGQPDYTNVFWQQSPMQQQLLTAQNGQRLFTAVSDPTVCGYSHVPLTYAMEPVSLPPMYQLYQQVPRPSYVNYRGRARRNHAQTHSLQSKTTMTTTSLLNNQVNGYSSLQENNFNYSATSVGYQNGDYASLPPAANVGNGVGEQEANSEHRRYSDPGLGPPEVHPNPSEDSESIDSGSSVTTVGRGTKMMLSLIEQVTALKESNSQLFKELHNTKSELENVKLELNALRQSNFADYQPGMLSDIVREMREAAKVREESLISKVKSMMNEKLPNPVADTSEIELDKLKNQLARITDEKAETETRLAKVEQELATLKSNANHEGQEIVALEEETLTLRRELQEARASRNIAESHASKCVNAVARPVTPATPVTTTPVILAISTTPCCSKNDNPVTLSSRNNPEKIEKTMIPKSPKTLTSGISRPSKTQIDVKSVQFPLTSSPKIGFISEKFDNDIDSIFDDLIIGSVVNDTKIVDVSISDAQKIRNSVITDRFDKNMRNFEESSRKKLRKSVIPSVAVVSGKSVAVAKKPCSVKILNSKGLKPPPTKSTYTTAYI